MMTDSPHYRDPENRWALEFARRHNITLRFESPLPNGVPGYKYDDRGEVVVVLDSSLPPPRRNFALSHECAHIILEHSEEVDPAEEVQANLLAAELLLPERDFAPLAAAGLRELREYFPHASFEAIARRRLAFIPGVLTIVDNGEFTSRLSSENFAAPARITDLEWQWIGRAYKEKRDISGEAEGLAFQAVYVDEGRGVVRVLLYVEAS